MSEPDFSNKEEAFEALRKWHDEIRATLQKEFDARTAAAVAAVTQPLADRIVELEAMLGARHALAVAELERAAGVVSALEAERDALRAELERERMRLVACSVVSKANTPESAARERQMHADYRSPACDDVATAVDREMALRAQVEAARAYAQGRIRTHWRVPDVYITANDVLRAMDGVTPK